MPNQSKNNQKPLKTIKNRSEWGAPLCIIFDCFLWFLIVFWLFWHTLDCFFDCFSVWGIVFGSGGDCFEAFGLELILIVFCLLWGLFDCAFGLPPLAWRGLLGPSGKVPGSEPGGRGIGSQCLPGSTWGYFGIIVRSFRDQFGVMLRSLWHLLESC